MDQLVRCKHFDDNGNPIGPGCRFGSHCLYIHPSDPIWSTAMPFKGRKSSDRFKDDGHGPGTDSGYSKRTSSRGQFQRDSQSHTQHDPGRGSFPGRRGSTSSPTRKHGVGGSWSNDTGAWGSWSSSNEPGPSTSKSLDTFNQPSTNLLSGWGAEDTSGGWDTSGNDPTNAWDSSGWGEDTVQQTNIRAKESKPTPSFNQPVTNPPAIPSASTAFSRPQKPGDQPETGVDKWPPPLRKSTTDAASSADTTPRSVQDVEMKDGTPAASSTAPVPAIKKIPLPTRIRPPLPTRIKPASTPTEATDNKPSPISPQDWTRIPLSGSITGRINQDDITSDASGPISQLSARDPKDLHAKLIKELMNAVVIRHRLLEAEDRKGKWREARASQCYQHSTPAAQKKLESTNHQFSEEIGKLMKRLNSSLKRVVQYSDALSAHKDLLTQGLDLKKVLLYTDELRDWVADLELPKRIFAAKALIQQEKEEREAFRRRKREEVDALKNAIYELELKATDIWDDFCHLQYVQPQCFKEEFIAAENTMEEENPDIVPDPEKVFAELGVGREGIGVVWDKMKTVTENLNGHMPKIEELRGQIKTLEEEVASLRQKDQEIKEFHQEAGVKLKQMEQWKTEDKERLDRLSQQIESLHKHPRPKVNVPLPITADDLSPYINELVMAYVAKEIKPALDAIAGACERDNQLVKAELDKLVEQVVVKTYDLVQMSLRANGLIPRIVSHPL